MRHDSGQTIVIIDTLCDIIRSTDSILDAMSDVVTVDAMLTFDDRELKELEKDLKVFAERAYPFATRNTINTAAFDAQNVARIKTRQRMIQRNKFTIQSIQVEKARTLRVADQIATVGSTADYMEKQEFGSVRDKPAIATGYAAGQFKQTPRTRLPRPKNKMRAITLKNKSKRGRSRKQRNLIAIREAAGTTKPFVYLELQRSKGIFKVIGGKRRPRIKMVHSMTDRSVTVPRNPWLEPAVRVVEKRLPLIHKKSLEFQAKRAGLFQR